MCIGSPAMALTLIGLGSRRNFGRGFQKIYRDVEERWGGVFVLRNDNGRLRKITSAARTKEHDLLSPEASDKRDPIVAISRYSNVDGLEGPPYFFFLYGKDEVMVQLLLPLEADSRSQSNALLEVVTPRLADFPLVGGSISPAFAHSANSRWTVEDEAFRLARAEHPGFQFIPLPPMGGYLDGLGNWGEITLLGPIAQERLGVTSPSSTAVPKCLSQFTVGSCLIVQTADRSLALGTSVIPEKARVAYSQMAAYLRPTQSSVYKEFTPIEEWDRLTVDWTSGPTNTIDAPAN